MKHAIWGLSAVALLMISVLLSVLITLTLVRRDGLSQGQRFVSVDSTQLMLMLAEQSGSSDEEFTAAVRNFGIDLQMAMERFGEENVVVFDASMILTGAPDVTAQIFRSVRSGGQ